MTELLHSLGRRTERLLYLGVLLNIACIALFAVSSSADHIRERAMANTLTAVLECLDEEKMSTVNEHYSNSRKYGPQSSMSIIFGLIQCGNVAASDWFGEHRTYDEIATYIDGKVGKSPAEIRLELEKWADDFRSRPARFYEIEIPSEIAIDIAGNRITSPLTAMFAMLKIALIPVIFLWGTGLYCTRQHELGIIRSMQDRSSLAYATLFPHLLNSFPIIDDSRRSRKSTPLKQVINFHAIVRATYVAILMLGPAIFFPWVIITSVLDSGHLLIFILFFISPFILFITGFLTSLQETYCSSREIVFVQRIYGTR